MDESDTKIYIDKDGNKEYFNLKGKWHRLDGPAKEWLNGDKEWYKEGRFHREDGPAVEWSNGYKYWWVLNRYLEESEFNSWINRVRKCI